MLPLLVDPPRTVPSQPADSGENLDLPGQWMGGWMSMIDEAETMSLDGKSGGVAIEGLSEHELRTVMYLVGYPEPAGQPAPRLRHDPPDDAAGRDRTHVECAWAFPKEVAAQAGLRPVVRRRLLGPDQPAGLGGLRIRAARAQLAARPARPAGPDEDGVYQFVTRVAKAYSGSAAKRR